MLRTLCFCLILCLAGLGGCCAPETDLRSPVIDVHGHTFNAHYLPLLGIGLGKRDAIGPDEPPADWVIEAAVDLILGFTPWPGDDTRPVAASPRAVDERILRLAAERNRPAGEVQTAPMIAALRAELLGEDPEAPVVSSAASDPDIELGRVQLSRLFGTGTFAAFSRFLAALRDRDSDLLDRYLDQSSEGADRDQFKLFVSHMMDLHPIYDQAASPRVLLNIEEQMIRMNALQKRIAGSDGPLALIYFVAHNPFRDHWRGGTDGRALALVETALRDHGAYGVKVYPPSGYRPAGNLVPPPPTSPHEAPLRQWQARYQALSGDPTTLDRRMEDLFAFCENADIPLFAHSNTQEFEARKGYGRRMADPRFWNDCLVRHPDLRLCFAHAGGALFWFGTAPDSQPSDREWGRTVYELCTEYPNVYCEIGVHDQIVDETARQFFVSKLAQLFRESEKSRPFAFGDKVLYGTDFFMPIDVPISDYLHGYHTAFQSPELQPYYRRFFYGNALDYLDVGRRIERRDFEIPPEVRNRLAALGQ